MKFCPHDLFVNTRADLGQCTKMHDEEAKRLFEEARPSNRKRVYEDEFLRFCNNMINEVDRKIQKGKQRLLLMNKGENGGPLYVSKFQEQLNNLNARIKKLIGEAEEAGNRGDVDQAQGLMKLCDQLKDEKENLLKNHDNGTGSWAALSNDLNAAQEKQMEVCQVCGAFLIVGDAQQRIEDHLTGKQHLGYSRLRKAVDEMYEQRKRERDDVDTRRVDDERRPPQKPDFGVRDKDRRNRFVSTDSRELLVGYNILNFLARDDFEEKRPRRDDRVRRDRDRREIRSSERRDRSREGKDRDRRNHCKTQFLSCS